MSRPTKGRKLAGIVLIVVGLLSLVSGGFTYTKDTDDVNIGPIHVEVEEKERVKIPVWAGAAAVVAGTVLLVL